MLSDGLVWAALAVVIATHAAAVVVAAVLVHRMQRELAAVVQTVALLAAAHERATGEPVPLATPLTPLLSYLGLQNEPETDVIVRGAARPWQVYRDVTSQDDDWP